MNCLLCETDNHVFREGEVRDIPSIKIKECNDCGLVYLDSHEHIDNVFYEESKMHGENKMPDILKVRSETHKDDLRRYQYLKEKITNVKVLDFGCGAGGFLSLASETANYVCGVDLEKRYKQFFQDHSIDYYSSVSAITKNIKFDVITLFHCLEHLPEPHALLAQLKNYLAPGGAIIIEVPNASDALLTLYKSEAFSKFTYWSCHLYLFTAHTLGLLAEQTEFRLDYVKNIQRYSLSNHLYWMAKNKPGGHEAWHFLDNEDLSRAYEKSLSSLGVCDTLIAQFSLSDAKRV